MFLACSYSSGSELAVVEGGESVLAVNHKRARNRRAAMHNQKTEGCFGHPCQSGMKGEVAGVVNDGAVAGGGVVGDDEMAVPAHKPDDATPPDHTIRHWLVLFSILTSGACSIELCDSNNHNRIDYGVFDQFPIQSARVVRDAHLVGKVVLADLGALSRRRLL